MKSHILTFTIKSVSHFTVSGQTKEHESFVDHFEVFCDEDENGINTFQQAKNRLEAIETEYANKSEEIWTSNISLIVETSEHYQIESDNFPENKISWLETHFQVVNFITLEILKETNEISVIKNIHDELGHSGLMQLSVEWTKDFEKKYDGISWGESKDDLDYYNTIDSFLVDKNKL